MSTFDACEPLFDASVGATAQTCKAAGGKLYGIVIGNIVAAQGFLQLFDALAADVTVGATTPNLSIPVAAGDGANYGGIDFVVPTQGIGFHVGITYACTTTPTGNTALSTPPIGNFLYQ